MWNPRSMYEKPTPIIIKELTYTKTVITPRKPFREGTVPHFLQTWHPKPHRSRRKKGGQ